MYKEEEDDGCCIASNIFSYIESREKSLWLVTINCNISTLLRISRGSCAKMMFSAQSIPMWFPKFLTTNYLFNMQDTMSYYLYQSGYPFRYYSLPVKFQDLSSAREWLSAPACQTWKRQKNIPYAWKPPWSGNQSADTGLNPRVTIRSSPALAGSVLDALLGKLVELPGVPRGHVHPVHELGRGLPERRLNGDRVRRQVILAAAAAGGQQGRQLGRPRQADRRHRLRHRWPLSLRIQPLGT